jgi:hypothetical protein
VVFEGCFTNIHRFAFPIRLSLDRNGIFDNHLKQVVRVHFLSHLAP